MNVVASNHKEYLTTLLNGTRKGACLDLSANF